MLSKLFSQPIWLVGFRPFFFLAFLAGIFLPLIWVSVFGGRISFTFAGLSSLQWHAHEMLFGFGWAILGGFLLTASKNWVKIRGMHGFALSLAVAFWIFERVFLLLGPPLTEVSLWILLPLINISVLYVLAYVVGSLIIYRERDNFSDNYFFILGLPLLLVSKSLLLIPETFVYGVAMSIGIFRLAFAVMFERTTTQFMKNAMGTQIYRSPLLDTPIKIFVFLGIFQAFFPPIVAALILTIAAILLFVRFSLWKPHVGFRNFGVALMYIGYLGLSLHFAFEAAKVSSLFSGVGSLSVHIFTFLCMGVVIPAMIIRISQGHTGRKLLFTTSDKFAISSMLVASGFRLLAPQLWPQYYLIWMSLAGIAWALCFLVIAFRLTPFLFQARIDGREH